MGGGENVYPGQRVAPFTEAQSRALENVGDYADIFSAGRGMPLFAETGQALGDVLSGRTGAEPLTPTAMEQYYQTNIEQPAQRKWATQTKPAIAEEYAGPGYWGSARAGAMAKGGTELQNWLGEQRGQLSWDTLKQNQAIQEAKAGRALSAVPLGMQYGQLPTQEAAARVGALGNVFGFAGQGQAQQQAEIEAAIQKFREGQRLTPEEDMAIMLALLGMNYSSSTSAGWGRGSQSGWGVSGLGALL